MATSRIEQIIDDIYDFVDGCRTQALSPNKVIVPKDTLYNLLDELRLRTPDEIKRYQKIIANRDAIINDAETKAQTMIAEAEEKAKNMISEHEIMQQAYLQANELVSAANEEAVRIRDKAKQDADEIINTAKGTAEAMTDKAKAESDHMVNESFNYASELLSMIDKVISDTLSSSQSTYDAMHKALSNSLDVIHENRSQLDQDGKPSDKKGKRK